MNRDLIIMAGYATLSIERKRANFVGSNPYDPCSSLPNVLLTFFLFGDGNGQSKSQFNVSRGPFKSSR
jgi:hypothetical protein